MFGISFWKIVLLVAVIAIVWFGYRWLQRWQHESQARARAAARRLDPAGKDRREIQAETMVACRLCGAYVVAAAAKRCGRRGCPYPG